METLAIRIKDLREEKNLNQRALATLLETNQASVAHWESGKVQPTAPAIIKLAKALDVTTDYLLGLDDQYGTFQDLSQKNPQADLPPKVAELVELCKNLNTFQMDRILGYVEGMIEFDIKNKFA